MITVTVTEPIPLAAGTTLGSPVCRARPPPTPPKSLPSGALCQGHSQTGEGVGSPHLGELCRLVTRSALESWLRVLMPTVRFREGN